MKKILCITILLVCSLLTGFSQQNVIEKTVTITSNTLVRGGDYVLIPQTLGRTTAVTFVTLKYVFKGTPYVLVGADKMELVTDTGLSDDTAIMSFVDNSFTATRTYDIWSGAISSNAIPSNEIILRIPSGYFTVGNADLIFTIEYVLIK